MKPSLFVRKLNPVEREALEAGLLSQKTFTLRRGQIFLASADGRKIGKNASNIALKSPH